MASSSSSLPLPSTHHQNQYTYEVFLSFRGEDTRYTFTDHLHRALIGRGIRTFRDNEELNRGEDISQELLKAIEESRVSIIIFSPNYASSRWCLDELVHILECRRSKRQEVRPVFHRVDPSDVRKQTGAFGEAFAKLDQCKYKDRICIWRKALEEAADLSGWPYKDDVYEAKFIDDIVDELSAGVVNPSCMLDVADHPIGLQSCCKAVNELLDMEKNVVRMIGIWGAGGIGKTTIAKALFNSIRHMFDGSCFLADVRSNSNGLTKLQEILLFDVLGDSTLMVSSVDQGVGLIKTRMQRKKVLIILDDVSNHSSQLKKLVPSHNCFGRGSRILITTRDKGCLREADEVYEVKSLDDCQAMNLFSLNAFRTIGAPSDYLKLAQRAIRYAQGLPLALIVLGSHLFRRSRDEWEATIGSCRGDPHMDIRGILIPSYDALGEDLKEIFLDIACFFKGMCVDDVKPILQACYGLNASIEQLQEKALLRIDKDEIWMHDLIAEMGEEIANPEGKPDKSTRLWRYDDVKHALSDNTRTKKIKGIHLECYFEKDEIYLNAKSVSKMKNLRYFFIRTHPNTECSGSIDRLSNELRWLEWYRCPLQLFPSNFPPHKLAKLNIQYSPHITRLWAGHKNMPNLKYMDLTGCESLTKLPDCSGIPNLIQLRLSDCESLAEIHHSVGSLNKLEILDLTGCTRLQEFPKITGKMDSLRNLNLSFTGVKELDPSIGNLIGLKELNLNYCENLTTLPYSIYDLQNLELLKLSRCLKLVTFPRKASISHDNSGSLALPKLREFYINDCNLSSTDFIRDLDCLETLKYLNLSMNDFVTLPALGKFVNLSEISLFGCKRLREIPELPPTILQVDVWNCESLERFSMLPKSKNTVKMDLGNCDRFSECLGNDIKMMENILLNNQDSRFCLVFPGCEVPKWFHYCSTIVPGCEVPEWFHCSENGWPQPRNTYSISFELPRKLNLENIGVVVICSAICTSWIRADLSINGVHIHEWVASHLFSDHMWVGYIPLSGEIKGKLLGQWPYKCQVEFEGHFLESCGVHLVCQLPNEIVMAAEPEPAGESSMLSTVEQTSFSR